jgi:hypothetical protein
VLGQQSSKGNALVAKPRTAGKKKKNIKKTRLRIEHTLGGLASTVMMYVDSCTYKNNNHLTSV